MRGSLCFTLPILTSTLRCGYQPHINSIGARGWIALSYVVQLGQLVVLFVVTYMCFLAQPRVFYALARDGLLPQKFAELNDANEPWFATLMTGFLVIICGTFLPFDTLANAISGGVCVNFNLVNCCVVMIHGGQDG
eukprot:g28986.t1